MRCGFRSFAAASLTAQDRRGTLKVMVVSEALARAAFGDADPIGKRISCCEAGPDGGADYKTVVGVAGDVRRTRQATRRRLSSICPSRSCRPRPGHGFSGRCTS